MSDLSQVTVVILAGGLGTRLREVVPDRPKVMAEINGIPFLYYLLDQLVDASIEKIVISTGYMGHLIEETLGSGYKGLQIEYSKEDYPLGTAGALKLSGQFVETNQCLVMNGDSYTEFDPYSLFMFHKQKNANMTLLVKNVDNASRFGTTEMNEENEIVQFNEKDYTRDNGIINAGVYIMETSVFKEIPSKIPCSLEYDFFPSMIGQGIYGYKTEGRFIDIGTPESYVKAEKFFECKPVSA
tara:strand:+ start:159 stop:881 length:723 start_codon:yes stop_codon:yes gene_type:complete